ncbi:hypothetical protein TKK_0012668 [Trichogramma kaykai]|uniref:PHD-type domain-containing protein n=1 Tax=Trichogramma kaykai TaxID=54128 RepID=A0ABD2WLH5_9HYME
MDDISSFVEVELREGEEVDVEEVEPVGPVQASKPEPKSYPCQEYSQSENEFYKLTYGKDIPGTRFMRLHCTGCDEHIGSAPSEEHNMHEHPVLRTLLCFKCWQFYGDGNFEQGEDKTDMFCRWCANGGNLYCCSACSNTFCSKCIKRNFEPNVIKRIEEDENWKCFVCDPCDIFPLRSLCRALLEHIKKTKFLLEFSTNLDAKTKEEKMHLDESKCCLRKRRKRTHTLSLSDDDDDDDDETDDLYLPHSKRNQSKKRKSTRKSDFTNGHSKEAKKTPDPVNTSAEFDPSDLLIPCEQTMIEGDEILNPENAEPSRDGEVLEESTESSEIIPMGTIIDKQTRDKIETNGPMGNKTFANLLKAAMAKSNNKTIQITTTSKGTKTKLVAVPISRVKQAMSSNSLKIVKPPTHFLLSNSGQRRILPKIIPKPIPLGLNSKPQSTPKVINLDDEDEEEDITEAANTSSYNQCNGTETTKENQQAEESSISIPDPDTDLKVSDKNDNWSKSKDTVPNPFAFENSSAMKTKNRDLRFKKMLQLQGQEIENTISELKTKIYKLIQNSNLKPAQDGDLLQSAALSTKRFHRAMKKTLAELAHINDRLVRDFLHWKKRADVIPDVSTTEENKNVQTDGPSSNNSSSHVSCAENSNENEVATIGNENKTDYEVIEIDNRDSRQFTNVEVASNNAEITESDNNQENKENQNEVNLRVSRKTNKSKDDIPLEMICERDSASDSSDDEMESTILKPTITPLEFASLLDHLSIFKKKITCNKSAGDNSIAHTEDRGCQVDIVPKRDFEKCIGYSLVNRAKSDAQSEEPFTESETSISNNFDKYQEQYLFYLQHIEDNGIETDETKGLTTETNHIPEKTPTDSSTLSNNDEICPEISLIGSRPENNTFSDFTDMQTMDCNLPSLIDHFVQENNHNNLMTESQVDEPEILSYYQSPNDMDALLEIVKKIPENLET